MLASCLEVLTLMLYWDVRGMLFCRRIYIAKLVCYRHVILPQDIAKLVPKNHLMTETEWRNLGVQQSPGWIHYMVHAPGKHKTDKM